MKKTNFLFTAMIALFVGFASCTSDDKDETPQKETTVAEDKENIKQTMESFYSCLETLEGGEFSEFFFNMTFGAQKTTVVTDEWECGYQYDDNGDIVLDEQGNPVMEICTFEYETTTSHLNELGDKFQSQFGKLGNDQGGFDYTGLKGKYVWDFKTKKWNKSNSNVLEIQFPTDTIKTTNNAKLVVDSYEDQKTSFGKDKPMLPKKGHLAITVDDKKTFEVTISNVTYDVGTNVTIPTSANVEIFTAPFTSKLTVKRNTPEEFEIVYDLNSDKSCGYTLYNLVSLKGSDYENIASEKDFKGLKGYFSHNDLKVTYDVDVDKYNKLGKKIDELTDTEMNELLDAEVLYNGVKISDLIINSKDQNNPLFLIYKDGTRESTEDYVKDFNKKIQQIFKRYIDAE